MGVLRELRNGAGAILALLLGVVMIATIFTTAMEMAVEWWTWILGGAIALGIAGVAALILYGVLANTVGTAALGWAGMCTGRKPTGFGPKDQNFAKGLGNLVLFAVCAWLGWKIYRAGVRGGQTNWTIEGLMLIASGTVIGLLSAVPRFYYVWRGGSGRASSLGRGGRRDKPLGEQVEDAAAALLTIALCSVALSMCVTDTVQHYQSRSGEAELAYGDWFDGCIEPDGDLPECARETVVLHLRPRRAVRQRIEYLGACKMEILAADGTPIKIAKRTGDAKSERLRARFDVAAGQRYRIEIKLVESGVCVYSARFFDEPEGDS